MRWTTNAVAKIMDFKDWCSVVREPFTMLPDILTHRKNHVFQLLNSVLVLRVHIQIVSGHYNHIGSPRQTSWCMNPKRSKSFWSLRIHTSTGLARWSDVVVVPGNNVFRPCWGPVHAAQPSLSLSQRYQSPGDPHRISINIGNGVGGSPHLSRECWVRKPPKTQGPNFQAFLVHSALE